MAVGVALLSPPGKQPAHAPQASPLPAASLGEAAVAAEATPAAVEANAAIECLNPASSALREFLLAPGLRLQSAGAYLALEEIPGATVQEDLVNFHYREGGRELRAQVFGEPEEGGERARFFSVGEDDFPDPVPAPAGVDARSAESVWAYLRGKDAYWVQRNRVIRLEDGASVTLVTENDAVTELQVRDAGGARWVCAFETTPESCRCL